MGYRGCSSLRGCHRPGVSGSYIRIFCRHDSEETGRCYRCLRGTDNACGFRSRESFRAPSPRSTSHPMFQVYRLYHVWKPHWWICIIPAMAWVGVTSMQYFVHPGEQTSNCCVQSLAFVRSGPWPAPVSPPECFNIGSSYGSPHRSSSPFRGFRLGCTPSRLLTSGDSRNNVYCTVAIIFRLWRSHRSVAGASVNSYVLRALRVFAESAALLT